MHQFSKRNIIILPHSEEYRNLYGITLNELVLCLNEPELHEGLSDDRFTVEKTVGKHRIYLYYYKTFPLQGKQNELYAIIDFIGYSIIEE